MQYEQETGLPFELAAYDEYKRLQAEHTRPDGPTVPPCRTPERSADQGRLHEGERITLVLHLDPLAASHGQDSHGDRGPGCPPDSQPTDWDGFNVADLSDSQVMVSGSLCSASVHD